MTRHAVRGLAKVWLLTAACAGGSETGNPVIVDVGVGLRSSQPEVVAVSSGTEGTVIEQAWVSFGELAFLAGSECALLNEYEYDGPTLSVLDLARPGAHLSTEAQTGSYCGLVVPLQLETDMAALPDGAPRELIDHSVVLMGRRADGTPFVLAHSEDDELELVPAGDAIEIGGDGAGLLLYFDVARWMADVDLDSAEVGEGGVIRIDAEQNDALHLAFEEAAECSLDLLSDDDADGKVGEGDRLIAACSPE